MTSPDAEVIGIVDSDYQVDPGWLRRCAPAFADPWIGFVQSPQDYRDWQQARYYRRLYYSYKYFFAVSQPSRNEHDGAIFAGTMGLIRRVALDELGGWDEWCITEDAELSLRLLRAGWHGLHVDETFGRGIMPLTFEALKGQRYRWCFGGIQILRMHWRSMIPGRPNRANHLNAGQRWAYLAGALQWYGDLLGFMFFIFLLAGAANLATGGGRAGDGPAGPHTGGGTAAPRYRRVLAGRGRRVLHLAVDLAGRGPRVGARLVRQEGCVPAHPEDQRADQVVGGPSG
jgi:cellulose synthase/poly-beta-1,6-N-acetylglucosamine synthase-like glycosyltransferase